MAHPGQAVSWILIAAASLGALALAGCDKSAEAPPPAAIAAPVAAAVPPAPAVSEPVAAAAAPAAYTPPTAEQLYQMVAPMALYPDKLVAQVLAGSTYPDQVTAASAWLARHPELKAGPLADAADQQPWDASIKSLTAFRSVLDQMAKNPQWTAALGQAYYSDPVDVMNAIQVMRQRASKAGRLKSTPKLNVATGGAAPDYTPDPDAQAGYAGPAVVEAPPQFITIAPAQPDVVYVPSYDPQAIYGDPVPAYPGYAYAQPQYSNAQIATAGALTFGLGVVVGAALERHDWGWHAWGVNWGGRARPGRGADRRAPPPGAAAGAYAYQRPAVVYNRAAYVSRSETVVNRNVRNVYNNGPSPQSQMQQGRQQQAQLDQQQQQQQAQRMRQTQAQQAQQARQTQRAQQAQQEQMRRQQGQQAQQQMQQQAQIRQQQEQGRQQQMQQARNQQNQAQARQQQTQQEQARDQQQARDRQAQTRQQQQQQQQQQQVQQQARARRQQAQQAGAAQQGQAQQQQQEQARRQQAQQAQQMQQMQQMQQQRQQQAQQAQQARQSHPPAPQAGGNPNPRPAQQQRHPGEPQQR